MISLVGLSATALFALAFSFSGMVKLAKDAGICVKQSLQTLKSKDTSEAQKERAARWAARHLFKYCSMMLARLIIVSIPAVLLIGLAAGFGLVSFSEIAAFLASPVMVMVAVVLSASAAMIRR